MTKLNVEYITHAAIEQDGQVFTVPRPGRHHDVMEHMYSRGWEVNSRHVQGFFTSDYRFVDRREALAIAKAADQLIRKTPPDYELFSEDLW